MVYFSYIREEYNPNKLIINFLYSKTMNALVKTIIAQCEEFAVNATAQAEKGNKAAGARARKNALDIMKSMKEFRKESVAASKK